MAVGRWPVAVEQVGRWGAGGRWPVAVEQVWRWRVAGGRWAVAGGRWRGRWPVAVGSLRIRYWKKSILINPDQYYWTWIFQSWGLIFSIVGIDGDWKKSIFVFNINQYRSISWSISGSISINIRIDLWTNIIPAHYIIPTAITTLGCLNINQPICYTKEKVSRCRGPFWSSTVYQSCFWLIQGPAVG